jgi:hypothetical protein
MPYVQETATHPGGYYPGENEITRCNYCDEDFEFDEPNEEFTVPYTSIDGKGYCSDGCELAEAADVLRMLERATYLELYHGSPMAALCFQRQLDKYRKHWPAVKQTVMEGL